MTISSTEDSSVRWASRPTQQVLAHFEVDAEQGLSLDEVSRRRDQFGPNELMDRGSISPWQILLAQFQDLMVLILLVATVVAFGSWL